MIDSLRNHGPDALEDLLAQHGREIHVVAYLLLRDRSDAEDVLGETLLTAWERVGDRGSLCLLR